ncbi:unnamed protein product [Dibothriocephalus latus]|uniref:Deoxynucleoside kinase domain-containing protein n=1 Tax=Dibothriocephalus latus TaxID=60516 RepID=A0A3P7NIV5_DIBLA|nr:unnamed protein product [Dibothriocephalus latus]
MALPRFSLSRLTHVAFSPFKTVSRSLKLVSTAEFEPKKPPRFDYLRTGYPSWLMYDNTTHRFTENTKLISVEGNVASGKSQVAKKLAELFGMNLVPDPTDEDIYVLDHYNPPIDIRMHNTLLPKEAQYYTTEMFWNEDNLKENGKPLYLQYQFYLNRYWKYLKGMCTLFNTGQGCITERSHFSDVAFAEALLRCGYISEYAFDWFSYLHASTALHLWKPHLIVYVKATNSQIREAIKKRAVSWEINAKNLTDNFFTEYTAALESYLERMSRYSHIFVLAEKLTDIDLEGVRLIRDDYMLLDWRNGLFNERSASLNRQKFSSATLKFSTVFKKFPLPLDMKEGIYGFDSKELQYYVYKRVSSKIHHYVHHKIVECFYL